jgi:predicted nucleic acid-binding protein
MRVYLDNCCFNRPYDDQTQILIRLETEAKLQIQQLILKEELDLIWSFILHYENNDNPYNEKKERIAAWESIAKETVVFNKKIDSIANDMLKIHIRPKDALHIACAICANASYFITTDRRLYNKPIDGVEVIGPVNFLERYYDEK